MRSHRHCSPVVDAGGRGLAIAWQLPLAALALLAMILFISYDPEAWDEDAKLKVPSDEVIEELVLTHCVMCHAAEPVHGDFRHAPGGVKLEEMRDIKRHAARVVQQVKNRTMPLANLTGMTAEERKMIEIWSRHL